jgi:hypothetical protein
LSRSTFHSIPLPAAGENRCGFPGHRDLMYGGPQGSSASLRVRSGDRRPRRSNSCGAAGGPGAGFRDAVDDRRGLGPAWTPPAPALFRGPRSASLVAREPPRPRTPPATAGPRARSG